MPSGAGGTKPVPDSTSRGSRGWVLSWVARARVPGESSAPPCAIRASFILGPEVILAVTGGCLTPEPSRLRQGDNVTVMLLKWTLHKEARPEPSWKRRQLYREPLGTASPGSNSDRAHCSAHGQQSQHRWCASHLAVPPASLLATLGKPEAVASEREGSRAWGEPHPRPVTGCWAWSAGARLRGGALNTIPVPIKAWTWP